MNTTFLTSDDYKIIDKYDLIPKQDFLKFCTAERFDANHSFAFREDRHFPTDYVEPEFNLYGKKAQYYLDIIKYGVNPHEPRTYPNKYKNNKIFAELCSILMDIHDAGYSEQMNFNCDGGRDLILGFTFNRISI